MQNHSSVYVILIFAFSCLIACSNESGKGFKSIESYPKIDESPESIAHKDSLLATAKLALESDSSNLENWIWYGRRMAYTHDYKKSVDIYSEALERFPLSPELYRHRGHRYITLRNFQAAINDLTKSSEMLEGVPVTKEKDGIPNKLNIPLSNLHFNTWYHLGLAHYMNGEFIQARTSFKKCMKYSNNADLLVATTEWLYKASRRFGDTSTSSQILDIIRDDFKMIENEAYFDLIRMYKGELTANEILEENVKAEESQLSVLTKQYGLGNWYLCEGDTVKAKKYYKKIIKTNYWPAFGYIAAEADLNKLEGN